MHRAWMEALLLDDVRDAFPFSASALLISAFWNIVRPMQGILLQRLAVR